MCRQGCTLRALRGDSERKERERERLEKGQEERPKEKKKEINVER
jgi:hypothetical protein